MEDLERLLEPYHGCRPVRPEPKAPPEPEPLFVPFQRRSRRGAPPLSEQERERLREARRRHQPE